ncbi:hypothetical protein VCNEP21106_003464, partial [Vibrio cholerae O1 str. Nep-21106]
MVNDFSGLFLSW